MTSGADDAVPRRALVVEDHIGHARLIRDLLEAVDPPLEVHQAGRLDSARERLETEDFHIVIADLHLPDGQGSTIVSTLVAAATDMPIVVVSALDDEQQWRDALSNGAQDWLLKDRLTVDLIGHTIRLAAQRAEVDKDLRAAADHDARTGALTRAGVRRATGRALSLAQRQKYPITIVHLRLQAERPEQLEEYARVAVATARTSDLVARIASDLVVLVLPDDRSDPPAILGRLQARAGRAGIGAVVATPSVRRFDPEQPVEADELLDLPTESDATVATAARRRPLRRVLLASDDTALGDAVTDALGADCRLLTVVTEGQARRVAALEEPHIAVVDFALPAGDAALIARTVAEQRESSTIPIVGVAPAGVPAATSAAGGLTRMVERAFVGGELVDVLRRSIAT